MVRTLGTFRGVLGYFKALWCGLYEHFRTFLGVLKAEKPSQTGFFPEVRTSFCHFEPSGANFWKIFLDDNQDVGRQHSAVRPMLSNQRRKTTFPKLKKEAKKVHLNHDISPNTTKFLTKSFNFVKLSALFCNALIFRQPIWHVELTKSARRFA